MPSIANYSTVYTWSPWNADNILSSLNLTTLASRRNDISRKFFDNISLSSSCLHHLLPVPREHSITSRLRYHQKYAKVYTRTKRYTSYIHHAINNYQDKIYNSWIFSNHFSPSLVCLTLNRAPGVQMDPTNV